jgi:hypothetical protein
MRNLKSRGVVYPISGDCDDLPMVNQLPNDAELVVGGNPGKNRHSFQALEQFVVGHALQIFTGENLGVVEPRFGPLHQGGSQLFDQVKKFGL